VRVAGDQLHAGQAAGGQAAPERQPAGAVFGAGDVQAEDLAVPVGVHRGGQQPVHVYHPAALADLQRDRVGPAERVRTGIQRPGPERGHRLVQFLGHPGDLRLRQAGDAEGLDQLLHPPGGHPEQIAGGDHADQRRLAAPALFQQPVWEVGARTHPRDGQFYRPHPGVPRAGSVAVARVHPLAAALPVAGVAQRLGVGVHQHLGEQLHHVPQQIRTGLLQALPHQAQQILVHT
jgi:hypothetical protein